MSIPFSGRLTRTAGKIAAIAKQLKLMSLKPVNKITVQFDPFYENVAPARDFIYYISAPKILKTNLSCLLKTNIVCDQSEPTVTCDLSNGEKVLMKCANLDVIDMLKLYNKHITPLAPPEINTEEKTIVKLKKKKIKIRTSRHRR